MPRSVFRFWSILIAVALLFDFLNGLHDAANSIATIVSTRVLRPQYAVLWAAFFNFIAFLVFGLHVANTIGTGIIEPERRRCHRDLCGAGRRHRLEPDHLGARDSLVQFARADRRAGRRRHGEGRDFGGGLERPVEDAAGDRAVAAGRIPAGAGAGRDRVLAVGALDAVCGRPRLPHPAIRLGLALFARPWRQRRAEDHGHHRGAALFAGPSRRRISRSRSGWCWPARPRWRWAR